MENVASVNTATIYDIGMHDGSDTEYYLTKGFRVIAVEANPLLCAEAAKRFEAEIVTGRLQILNIAIADKTGTAEFFVKQERAPQSSLRRPADMAGWHSVTVKTAPLADIVDRNAEVAYMKIDIERADVIALESLAKAGIHPPMISAEAHAFEVLLKLYGMGYTKFRVVNGNTVHKEHKNRSITLLDGSTRVYSFRGGSSGPFGDDLPARWQNIEQAALTWLCRQVFLGGGWYDIHAA